MCGSTEAQDEAQQQQADFSKQMIAENAKVFGQQQSILATLNTGFQAIIDRGPSQRGFSQDQLDSLDTSATESVAANMTSASKALQQGQNAQGGGNTFIPSGLKTQQDEQLAEAGVTADATTKNQILQADYTQGNANYNNAVTGQLAVAGDLAPVGYSQATTQATTASADEANAIAAAANSPFTAVMGALGGVAGAATSAFISKH